MRRSPAAVGTTPTVARTTVVAAAVLDVACVLVFVGIGRSAHGHLVDVGGMASTAWPFLVGLGSGWAVIRAWRRPLVVAPSAIVVWLSCVAVGMILRVVAGQGTAVAFIGVALTFLGATLLGWRAVAWSVPRIRARSSSGTIAEG